MARIRTIKPEFWSDDTVTECSLSARLLFIGIWNFADDAGNLDRSHKQIKTRVFPLDNINCEPLILELITHGLLIEYSVSGKKYLHIPGFTKHQLINRPSKPVVPDYEESMRTPGVLTESSVTTHSGREGKGREGRSADAPAREKVRKSSRVPEDFLPDVAYAAVKIPDIDADAEVRKFRDWEFQTPRSDWAACWRTWIAKCLETGKYAKKTHGRAGHGLPVFQPG